MKLRNLIIDNIIDIPNKDDIIDAIHELDIIINDNYNGLATEERAIEFNIGSRLGEVKEWLVIYSNPEYKNNPYVFILAQINGQRVLLDQTDLYSFAELRDPWTRKDVNKTIAIGFNNLPNHAFLGQSQIEDARNLANQYDGFDPGEE